MTANRYTLRPYRRPPKHLFLPAEALIIIDLLEDLIEEATITHVAFICGVSRKHMEAVRRDLQKASRGDPEATKGYNSRTPIMRNLFLYNEQLQRDRFVIIKLLEDALLYADSEHNPLHSRGKDVSESLLWGLDKDEQKVNTERFLNYTEN
ncbi:TPA: hypothetical protein I7682_17890 [Vibrio vulnificus]|nr:hypothetical protein [Vibrio vulnificus]